MKIAIGSDHAGFELKEQLRDTLRAAGYEVADLGTASTESTDYPDFAAAVARAVRDGQAGKGILICSSGVGMSIAANKIKGIRAALGTNPEEVSFVRRHNDANVLAIGAKYTGAALAGELVNIFLTTEFEGGRHQRRLDKIKVLEQTE
ncbi:MAG: ribose 5-phosphate isomerase B [Acidobacteria bacterium]|jgi:ribose 5-phosphate isomerase B|nr:ribose 5-phosphate isomerase B [Acidobacteriota bacterium]